MLKSCHLCKFFSFFCGLSKYHTENPGQGYIIPSQERCKAQISIIKYLTNNQKYKDVENQETSKYSRLSSVYQYFFSILALRNCCLLIIISALVYRGIIKPARIVETKQQIFNPSAPQEIRHGKESE